MAPGRFAVKPSRFVAGLGVAAFLVAAAHHASELLALRGPGPAAAFLLDGTLALGFAYAGYWLSDRNLTPARQWTVALWSLAGGVLFVAVIGATFLIRVLEGRVVAEPVFPLLIAAEAGGLAGFVAGYYNARARTDAERAARARERVAAANRELEASNERLEQFAYAASHDLQEPLRTVVNYLELLERRYGDDLDEDGREFVAFAVDGAERMQAMIDSLLAYSRVETEGDPFEPVALDAVVEDVLADLRLEIDEQDADIVTDDLPRVEGDRDQLRQLFQNLLDNAIEYSGDEPPRVHLSAERDGSDWHIAVRDEGIGIDPEHTDRVFGVFQRLHTQSEHAGTGIGLAMCERIVERHGGEIRLDSEPGEGTTFTFTLPAADER